MNNKKREIQLRQLTQILNNVSSEICSKLVFGI